jgi:type II secretory pathway pseudopilin PulG
MPALNSPFASSRPPQRGVILLAALILVALVAMASVSVTLDTSAQHQRDNEEELLFVGEQYRQAIESYLKQSPNGRRQFPSTLADLVADDRFPQPRHHLRKLFRDPVAPGTEWALIKVGNALVGVHSQATGVPFRKAGFSTLQVGFAQANSYAEWEFKVNGPVVQVPGTIAPAPAPANPGLTPGTPQPRPVPGHANNKL